MIVIEDMPLAVPSAYPHQPATKAVDRPVILHKHEIDAVNQVLVRGSEARYARRHGLYLSI